MKMKKKLALLLTFAMTVMISLPVNAESESILENPTCNQNAVTMNSETTSRKKIEPEFIQESNENVMERQYTGEQYTVSGGLVSGAYAAALTENTDPNYAYLVANNSVYQGNITAAGEMRWYAFVLDQKSKVSIELQMVASLDADIYMFLLDGSTLNLIDGSANSGGGVTEFYNKVLEAGTYFFAVGGYEGTGAFAFAYYESTKDAGIEVNDSMETATPVSLNSSVTGIIDNPHDMDYYKITVTGQTMTKYGITTTDGYSLVYVYATGADAGMYRYGTSYYEFGPGEYYFAVRSDGGNYSSDSTYTVKLQSIGSVAVDSKINYVYISETAGIIFQSNTNGTVYYINGNPIDISYSYHKTYSFSEGLQDYMISINPGNDVYAVTRDENFRPEVLQYHFSTMPAMKVGDQAVLSVTFNSSRKFYSIHCLCTGAFKRNNFIKDYNAVNVLIDPATGKLVDILEVNYFYDVAEGSNSLSFGRPYTDFVKF